MRIPLQLDLIEFRLGHALTFSRLVGSRVADPGCLSRFPDPTFFHPGSRIRNKEFKYFYPQKTKKWFLSSGKYDPGCSSRIRMLNFLPIPDPDAELSTHPGSRIQGSKRHRIPDPDPQHWLDPNWRSGFWMEGSQI
jgi:hypothetical protein